MYLNYTLITAIHHAMKTSVNEYISEESLIGFLCVDESLKKKA
jgi:hypothetical protein